MGEEKRLGFSILRKLLENGEMTGYDGREFKVVQPFQVDLFRRLWSNLTYIKTLQNQTIYFEKAAGQARGKAMNEFKCELDALAIGKCKPCEGGMRPYSKEAVVQKLSGLEGWAVADEGKRIWKEYVMTNFNAAVRLIDRISEIAEEEGHHPDIHLTNYKKLKIELSTHAIGGVSENDFILAAKIEKIRKE